MPAYKSCRPCRVENSDEVLSVVGSLDPATPLKYEHLERLALCDGTIKE